MRRYETFVIIDPDISQEEREPVLDRVKELITQQEGFLVFEDHWGERKLAYEIKNKARGYYVRFDYCGLALLVNEIERFFRIDDRALKYMTVVLDKDADLEKVKEEKAAAESQREAAAESQREAAAESQREPAPETPDEAGSAELNQPEDKAAAENEELAEQKPPVEDEAPASDTEAQIPDPTESAENTISAEKKQEA